MRSRAKSLQLNEAPKHVFWGCLWACPEAPTLTSTVSRAIQPKLQGGGHTVSVFEGAEVAALCHAPAVTARCLHAAHGTPATVVGILTIFTPMPTIAPDEFCSFAVIVNLHVLEDGGQEPRGDGEQDGRAGRGSWRL